MHEVDSNHIHDKILRRTPPSTYGITYYLSYSTLYDTRIESCRDPIVRRFAPVWIMKGKTDDDWLPG